MGQDLPSSWATLKRPLWQCLNPLDAAANNMRLQLQQQHQHTPGSHHLHTERWVFAGHMNPLKQLQQQQQHHQAAGFVLPSALGISSLVMPQVNPALSRPIVTSTDVHAAAGGAGQERKFLIFDQSGSRTTMIFSSVSPALQLNGTATTTTTTTEVKLGSPLQGDAFLSDVVVNRSDGTPSVSQGSRRDGVNEETDYDIDALLYSDSEEEEAGNTGPCSSSPDMAILGETGAQVEEEEEVASSCGPSKRRRVDDDEEKVHDEALIDTAASSTTKEEVVVAMATGSSTTCGVEHATTITTGTNRDADEDESDRSSCVKGDSSSSGSVVPPKWAGLDHEKNPSAKGAGACGSGMWKVKRDHIRETVNVLRGIIPGCKGKDTCLVLDEAIRYLKSLELKVQTLGGTL